VSPSQDIPNPEPWNGYLGIIVWKGFDIQWLRMILSRTLSREFRAIEGFVASIRDKFLQTATTVFRAFLLFLNAEARKCCGQILQHPSSWYNFEAWHLCRLLIIIPDAPLSRQVSYPGRGMIWAGGRRWYAHALDCITDACFLSRASQFFE